MACRTPVVSTRIGWPEEAIEQQRNGVLVEIDDVAGLAEGISWVLTRSADEWARLSQRAYETACRSSWEDSSGKFEAALYHARRRAKAGQLGGGEINGG